MSKILSCLYRLPINQRKVFYFSILFLSLELPSFIYLFVYLHQKCCASKKIYNGSKWWTWKLRKMNSFRTGWNIVLWSSHPEKKCWDGFSAQKKPYAVVWDPGLPSGRCLFVLRLAHSACCSSHRINHNLYCSRRGCLWRVFGYWYGNHHRFYRCTRSLTHSITHRYRVNKCCSSPCTAH